MESRPRDPLVFLRGRKRLSSSENSRAEEESIIAESLTVDAISNSHEKNIERWIAGLEQELELVFQNKANIIRKEEAIHAAIQVLKGHKAALVAAVEEHDKSLGIIHKLKVESNELKKLLCDDESQFRDAKLKKTSSNSELQDLEDSVAEKHTAIEQVHQMVNALLERAIGVEHSMRDGVKRKIEDFEASVLNLEAVKSGVFSFDGHDNHVAPYQSLVDSSSLLRSDC